MDLDLLKLFRYLRRGYHRYESNWTRIHNHTTICYLYFISFNDMFILPIKMIVKVKLFGRDLNLAMHLFHRPQLIVESCFVISQCMKNSAMCRKI